MRRSWFSGDFYWVPSEFLEQHKRNHRGVVCKHEQRVHEWTKGDCSCGRDVPRGLALTL